MGQIFNVSFLIPFAVLSQEMVNASDDSLELSSDLHIRQKRMNPPTPAPPGSLASHRLPPFLAYNLHVVEMRSPAKVTITRNGNGIGSGYAIHSYLILTRSRFVSPEDILGVVTPNRNVEGYSSHRIQRSHPDPTGKFLLIQLFKPIFLDEPVDGAFHTARYPPSVTDWAYHEAMRWIPGLMLILRPLLRQDLNEVNFLNPLKVQVLISGRPSPGNGYAVHPYIVITRPEFADGLASVKSFIAPAGRPRYHRLQSRCPNRALDVDVLELIDPILVTEDENGAFTGEHYSPLAIEWARNRAEEWKRTRLNQHNFYEDNMA